MINTELIPYSSEYYQHVNNILVPNKYLIKYINKKVVYRLLLWFGIYKNYFLLLVCDHQVIGSILIRKRISNKSPKKFWWIYGVYINKNFRGEGFGKDIIDKSIIWLKAKKVNEVLLYVDRDNAKAINLYLKSGFEIIEKSKYHRIRSNQFLMRKEINV